MSINPPPPPLPLAHTSTSNPAPSFPTVPPSSSINHPTNQSINHTKMQLIHLLTLTLLSLVAANPIAVPVATVEESANLAPENLCTASPPPFPLPPSHSFPPPLTPFLFPLLSKKEGADRITRPSSREALLAQRPPLHEVTGHDLLPWVQYFLWEVWAGVLGVVWYGWMDGWGCL